MSGFGVFNAKVLATTSKDIPAGAEIKYDAEKDALLITAPDGMIYVIIMPFAKPAAGHLL